MRYECGDYRVELTATSNPEAARWERELLEAGFRLPFPHRTASTELDANSSAVFFMIRHASGAPCGGFIARRRPSQALPKHCLLRVERFGAGVPLHAARAVAVHALVEFSRATPRVLRTYLGVFSPDRCLQQELAAQAVAAGFQRNADRRGYSNTLLVDLRPDEETIFASLHATARRHIRAASKHPVEVRTIDAPALAGRLATLMEETFSRTGGKVEHHDWPSIIRFSARYPELSRVVGLFRTDRTGPESLLAFAHGWHHGEYAEYSTAASTRHTDLRLPQMYVLAWDLFRWAKQHGAAFFDFGGITSVATDGTDPLQGISAFKRYFSSMEVAVGDEWILEPSRLKARLARVVTSVASSVTRS